MVFVGEFVKGFLNIIVTCALGETEDVVVIFRVCHNWFNVTLPFPPPQAHRFLRPVVHRKCSLRSLLFQYLLRRHL